MTINDMECRNAKHAASAGFSLLTVAMFIICFGLMVSAVAPIYHIYRQARNEMATTSNVATVQTALNTFYAKNGYYPCPAPRNAALDGKNANGNKFGVSETCAALGGSNATDTAKTGTVSVDGRAVTQYGPAWKIRIGAVPVRTLGLPDNAGADAWGHLLTYAVTESYAVSTMPQGDMLHGAIKVVDSNGNDTTTLPGIAVYAVIAPGADDRGAWTLQGTQPVGCTGTGIALDNCNNYKSGYFRTTTKKSYGTDANAFRSTLTVAANSCTPSSGGSGKVGNVSVLVDSSGSMGTADVTDSTTGKKVTRLKAAQTALDTVIPLVATQKAANDPSNFIGVASFATYCEGLSGSALTTCQAPPSACSKLTGSALSDCKVKNGSCVGLTGTSASQCMFSSFDPTVVQNSYTTPGTFTTVVADPITQTASSTYTKASVALAGRDLSGSNTVINKNNMVDTMSAAGTTPLFDTMMDMADALQGGVTGKPNVLTVVSDGASNGDIHKNTEMIDAIATKYPNMQVEFVFVGVATKVPQPAWSSYTEAQKTSWCKSNADDASCVERSIFATTNPGGHTLNGHFHQVQETSFILSDLAKDFGLCPQY